MKVLILDHFFSQEIDCLIAAGKGHEVAVMPYDLPRNLAKQVFAEDVFDGLQAYHKPEYEADRKKFKEVAISLFEKIYSEFPFEVFITPSDTFFYIRDFIEYGQSRGIPTVAVLKEVSTTPYVMEVVTQELKEYFPAISDLLLVGGELLKTFWTKTGYDPNKIFITGQPRFDLYCQPQRWKSWEQLGLTGLDSGPTVVFLSYVFYANAPVSTEIYDTVNYWQQLREQTELVLACLVRQGFNVLVKPHPQQPRGDYERWLAILAGEYWQRRVRLIDNDFDVRQLIVNADVVVGFQTTVLFEAMAARKPVIYTFWTENVHTYERGLTPYHLQEGLLSVARSPAELMNLVESSVGQKIPDDVYEKRVAFFENHLGPFTGRASEKVWRQIEGHFSKSSAVTLHAEGASIVSSLLG